MVKFTKYGVVFGNKDGVHAMVISFTRKLAKKAYDIWHDAQVTA